MKCHGRHCKRLYKSLLSFHKARLPQKYPITTGH